MCGRPAGWPARSVEHPALAERGGVSCSSAVPGGGGTIWRILAAPASGILAADTVPARRMNVLFVMKGPGRAHHGGGRSSSRGMDGRRARNLLMDLGERCAVGAWGTC
jgi:hypothetical protein